MQQTMQFDLHLPISAGHHTAESFQRDILKAQSFATGASRSSQWRIPLPKAKTKGTLRFLTAWSSTIRRTPSWRQSQLPDWGTRPATAADEPSSPDSPVFNITPARSLSGQHREKPKYLAVSYCWLRGSDAEKEAESGQFYWVRDRQAAGGVRRTRARKSIIDRAVAFATDRDIRLIWIDQECINQGDREDKECGIRSMDHIFHNASKVIGLLETTISSSAEAQALRWLSRHQYLTPELYEIGIYTVQRISQDPWFSRAWILQEATSGGITIELSMRCIPSLRDPDVEDWASISEEWGSVEDEIQFSWAHIAKWISGLYAQAAIYDQHPPPELDADKLSTLLQTLEDVRMSLMNHFPLVLEPVRLRRPRLCCNAALALTFLRGRQNSRPTDRISIFANMGDYPIKLNTTKLKDFTMSSCVIAQALLNGDISLLTGISLEQWHNRTDSGGFTWLPPLNISLEEIAAYHEGYPSLRLSEHQLTEKGLTLQGYCWDVRQQVNVEPIRDKYFAQWSEVCIPVKERTVISALRDVHKFSEDENLSHFHGRMLDEAENYCRRDLQHLDEDYNASKRHKLGCQILWDLLCHLVEIGRLNLANAIWHSVRTKAPVRTSDELRKGFQNGISPTSPGVVDRSAPWLERHRSFPSGELPPTLDEIVTTENGRETLHKPCPGAGVRISRMFVPMKDNWNWIIDRIMSQGFLWAGNSIALHHSQDCATASCIFDVDYPCQVLTPKCDGMEEIKDSGRLISHSLPPMRAKRISWIIEPEPAVVGTAKLTKKRSRRRSVNEIVRTMSLPRRPTLETQNNKRHVTSGMVAGAWRLETIKSLKFTLI